MKKYTILLLLLLLSSNSLFGIQDTNFRNIFLYSSLAIQGNFYNSNFKSLPAYPSCCTNYDFANGMGYSLAFGMGYNQDSKILNSDISYLFGVKLSNLSANYSIDEFIGYYIDRDVYQKIISNYRLDVDLISTGIFSQINIIPPLNLPLTFSFGVNLDFPVSNELYKVEKLKKPDNITFTDTKSRIRGEQSGKIYDLSAVLYSISFGVSYYSFSFKNFTLQPKFELNYGLNNVVKNVDWKIVSTKLGMDVNLNIPKTKEEPKIQPINPPMPEPAIPPNPTFEYNLIAKYSNIELDDSSIINIPITSNLEADVSILPSTVFFQKNSSQLNNAINPVNSIAKSINLDSAFIKFIQNSEVATLVTINRLESENPKFYQERKEKITEIIKKFAPNNLANFEFQENVVKKDSINKKIEDEYICAKFEYKDFNIKRFNYYRDTKHTYYSKNRNVVFFNAQIPFDYENYKLEIFINDSLVFENDSVDSRFNILDDYFLFRGLVQTPMNVRTKVKLSNGIELAKNKTYLINPKLSRVNLLINSYDGKEYAILGLFDFDSSEFSLFDNRVREKVLDDLHYRGKKLTIIPFTDNIGSKEYNSKLAEKRALAAVQLLQLRDEDYKIEYPTQYLYDNRTPLGRILNRSVIIRIEK